MFAVLAALAGLLATAPAASAGPRQFSVMMDDDLMLYRGSAERDSTLDGMKRVGVDSVRLTVLWKVFAPRRRPSDPANPASYNPSILDRLDGAVQGAIFRGITPYFNITWPGPRWGRNPTSNTELRRLGSFRPRRLEFAKFVEMIGRRYSGRYRDENHGRRVLPRVNLWSIGNEPNQGGWLTPQSEKRNGRWIPTSPHLYRELYLSARAALDRSGHGSDAILLGELAPIGTSRPDRTAPVRPLKFLREMFCLDRGYRPFRGRSAAVRRCDNRAAAARIRATGFAYHPYTRRRSPFSRPANPDEVTIANLSRLTGVLDRIASRTHRLPGRLPIWTTEFGYETSPPDRWRGISPDRQAAFMNQGDFIAYRNPRVAAVAQFLFRDASPNRRHRPNSRDYYGTYQSGLFYSNSVAKPALRAYGLPIHVSVRGGQANVWGQLRFLPNNGPHPAEIQFRPQGSANYVPVLGLGTNQFGFFEKTIPLGGSGAIRAVWRDGDGNVRAVSRDVAVTKR